MWSFSAGKPGGKKECWGALAEPGRKVKISLFNRVLTCLLVSVIHVLNGSNDGINTDKVEQKGAAAKTMPNLLLCLGPRFH